MLGTVMSLQPVRPAEGLAVNREAAAHGRHVEPRLSRPALHHAHLLVLAPLVEKLVQPGDMEQIRQQIDFLGVNYYAPMYQRPDPAGIVGSNWGATPAGMRTTGMGWPIDPSGLVETLADLRDHYGNPRVYITENGAFFPEAPGPSGRIDDVERIAYLRDHIAACHHAIAAGANLGGYFIWTIIDNWEWAHGYSATFGLARVDRATLTRSPKASHDWFARIAHANTL